MELRPYQNEIVENIKACFKSGKRSPVVVLPCGGGKSIICADVAKIWTDSKRRVLFLVHRIELIGQIIDTFKAYGVDMTLCDVKMVQSSRSIEGDYDLIITDESHHATCGTYKRVYDKFPTAWRLNVTATPCRTDGRGLGETCDYLMTTVSTKWLIENKYLSPFEYYMPACFLEADKLEKIAGEYANQTALLDRPKIYGDIFKYYEVGKKAICYCASVEHSVKTAYEFIKRGISAQHIDGEMDKSARAEAVENFRTGKTMVLCNYGLIAEGFDVPDCDEVLLLRKTASLGLFIQMTMRCMRYREGKVAKILDFCGNAYEHGLPDEEREWSLDSKIRVKTNTSSEPDVVARTCEGCFRTYSGTARICPYCGYDNGKTRRELEQEKREELERVEEVKRKEKRAEQGRAVTFEELVKLGRERGYKNPTFWASMIIKGRKHR